MTIPVERTQAVINMREAAIALLQYAVPKIDGNVHVAVPVDIVRAICSSLRHYPSDFDMEETAKKLPKIWGWHE